MRTDKRCKDVLWQVCDDQVLCQDGAMVAVLMDIRDELKALRAAMNPLRHLDCQNFLAIPIKLDRIAKNTHKPKRRRKSVA